MLSSVSAHDTQPVLFVSPWNCRNFFLIIDNGHWWLSILYEVSYLQIRDPFNLLSQSAQICLWYWILIGVIVKPTFFPEPLFCVPLRNFIYPLKNTHCCCRIMHLLCWGSHVNLRNVYSVYDLYSFQTTKVLLLCSIRQLKVYRHVSPAVTFLVSWGSYMYHLVALSVQFKSSPPANCKIYLFLCVFFADKVTITGYTSALE